MTWPPDSSSPRQVAAAEDAEQLAGFLLDARGSGECFGGRATTVTPPTHRSPRHPGAVQTVLWAWQTAVRSIQGR